MWAMSCRKATITFAYADVMFHQMSARNGKVVIQCIFFPSQLTVSEFPFPVFFSVSSGPPPDQ